MIERLATIPTRVGAVALALTFVIFAGVIGYNVGSNAQGCYIVRTNAEAFRSDPAYWGTAMRTLVESCERGE